MSGNSLVGDGEKKKLEARCRSLAFRVFKNNETDDLERTRRKPGIESGQSPD
jgi:hypothetical protein